MPELTLSPHARPTSTLARLQAGMSLVALSLLPAAWLLWHETHPHRAALTTVLVLFGHGLVLGIECALAAWMGRGNPALRASLGEWLRAWWRETCVVPRVFAWRQPWRWRALPDTDRTDGGGVGAVVLVHGFVCNRGFWLPWMRAFRERGLPYVSVNLEPVFGSIDDYIPLLEAAVQRAEAISANPPSLVAHSMGGLVARAWLAAAPENRARVSRVITVGSPHRGTWLARFSHVDNGRQMRPDGPWLVDLARRETAAGSSGSFERFVCWYANTDNIVFPPETATLPGADNRLVRGAAHVDLAFHPRVMVESLAMLASASSSPSERTDS